MIPQHRQPTHPGNILLHEFLESMGLTQMELADRMGVSRTISAGNEVPRSHPKTHWDPGRVTRRQGSHTPAADDADSAARRGRMGWRRGRTRRRGFGTDSSSVGEKVCIK